MNNEMLGSALIFLTATVIAVPLAKRLKLGAVLGYLLAGVVIGPSTLGLINEPETVLTFSELGIVLLLFVLGLELSLPRLRAMQRVVFGLGSMQVAGCTTVLAAGLMALGMAWPSALVLGFALALSSTAFAVQLLAERGELNTGHGRAAFGVSLFQDLAAVPTIALVPLLMLGESSAPGPSEAIEALLKVAGAIALVVIGGRYLLRGVLRRIAQVDSVEVFAAMSLLVVLGCAGLMQAVGLSMGLGAFLAGVLLADSEYQHEIESHIEPYRGLLLGLFFIAVGMTLDTGRVIAEPWLIGGLVAAVLLLKSLVVAAVGYIYGYRGRTLTLLTLVLASGSEFAFVVLVTGADAGLLSRTHAELAQVVVALSMLATPALLLIADWWLRPATAATETTYEALPADAHRVVIAGYGRVGQIVARILHAQGVPYIAIDKEAESVEWVRKNLGGLVYFGDVRRPEILRSAGLDRAELFVLAIDDPDASVQTARLVRRLYPKVRIVARARNRQHAFRLLDLGVEAPQRETLESSLRMAAMVLTGLGSDDRQAQEQITRFRIHDEALLLDQHLVHDNEGALIETLRQASDDLHALFASDLKDHSSS